MYIAPVQDVAQVFIPFEVGAVRDRGLAPLEHGGIGVPLHGEGEAVVLAVFLEIVHPALDLFVRVAAHRIERLVDEIARDELGAHGEDFRL